jgi:siroheme synthase-like protein
MKYFPIFLTADNINAIIIGGGDVAARKIELLLKSTDNLTIMSADVNETVMRLIKTHQLTWLTHAYKTGFFEGKNLVIAATDDETVNEAISDEANDLNILVNVVDQPNLCTYITPAIIDRAPMIIALSSSGSAPILIRMLREQIEKMLPSGYGRLADFALKFREHVKARVKGIRNRRTFWEQILRGNIGNDILEGNIQHAEQQLINQLKKPIAAPCGDIVFIHTQDGNPDNLTLNAHRELQFADAVFYDTEVNLNLIEYVRRDADKYPQTLASSILINYQHALELAEQGKKVIYLLSGYEALPENVALSQSTITKKYIISGG